MTTEPNEPQFEASMSHGEGEASPRASAWYHDRWLVGLGAFVALMLAIGVGGSILMGSDETPEPATFVSVEGVSISPEGEEVGRLTPVIVTFAETPPQDDPASVVAVTPAVEGAYVWLDEHRLLFQPNFPGYERGTEYAVRVDAARAGLEEDGEQHFTVEGALRVDYIVPADGDVEVPAGAQVLVQFSRSVAALTTLDAADTSAVIEFDPPLPGHGEWLNTSLYRFTPDELRPSTTYEARIAAGLTSAAEPSGEGSLEADVTWSFTTAQPALEASDPADNTEFVSPTRPIVLTFNQSMDRAAVEAGLRLEGPEGAIVAFSTAWSDGDRTVTLTPSEPLALSTRYEVVIPAGLPGASGGETAAERRVAFRTSDPPAVVSSYPEQGATNAERFGVWLTFNNPMDMDSVESRISMPGLDAEDYNTVSYSDFEVFIEVTLQPSTDYEVRIANGATDRDGAPLGPYTLTFRTGTLPEGVTFAVPSQVVNYSASSDATLFFHTTNLSSVDFDLYRLTETDAAELIRNGGYKPTSGSSPWLPSTPPIRSWTEPIEGATNAVALGSTQLNEGDPLPKGDYYLVSSSGGYPQVLTISVVDVSLVTKLSFDELLIWALDSDTGEPLAGLDLDVTGPGVSPASTTTDGDGLASVSVPNPRDVGNQQRTYIVRTDDPDHRGVTSTDWQQGSYPWELGLPVQYWPQVYVGHLYTDRPIYRPGETVHFKAIVREDDDATNRIPQTPPPLRLTVRDAQFEQIASIDVTLNDFGTAAVDFELPDGASTGGYFVEFWWGPPNQQDWITTTSFTVAEFRRPEFEVAVAPTDLDVVDGGTIGVDVDATFYFGGAVGGAEVDWAALASPAPVSFEDYAGYSFNDFDQFETSILHEPLRGEGSTTTDDSGHATFEVPAALRGEEGTQRFDLSASVIDTSGQVVAGSTSVLVHPADFYAGVRPDGYVAATGEPASVSLVSVDVTGAPVGARDITLEVYEREWITTKEQTPGGARRYRSEPRDTLIDTIEVTTDASGEATATFEPENAGTLRLVAVIADDRGREARASTYLWVSGSGRASWQIRNDDVIELIADREQYDVGDTAEVLVPAPFPGAIGLVTLERGGILERSVRAFDSGSEVLRIPIEDSHLPNVYVSVVLYRPPTAEDPIPRYHVGYVNLHVSSEPRQLTVEVTPDRETARPGETARFDVDVTDSNGRGTEAELSFAVVDQAVLALADEVGPDGLRAFWFERGLGVLTASSASVSVDRTNDVISEAQAGGKGGGDEERLRQDFRNTAYWDAQVRTDADGHASIEVPLPDNLTTWRAQARAVSGNTSVGESTAEVQVSLPLLLRPALPRFLRVGDSTQLRALVRNATDAPIEVTVAIEASGVTLGDSSPRTVRVAPSASELVEWPATVDTGGTARVTFRADGDGESDSVSISLPVDLDVTLETTATGGVVTGDAGAEAVYLPEFALTDRGGLEVSVQGSLVGLIEDELEAFEPQPFETADRTASRLMATVAVDRALGTSSDVRTASIERDIASLLAARKAGGGWGWCRQCPVNERISAWVLIALGDASMAGHAGAGGQGGGVRSLLLAYAGRSGDVEDPIDPGDRAFIYYALAHDAAATGGGGSSQSNTVLGLLQALVEQERANLPNYGRAYAILGLLDAGESPDSATIRLLLNDLSASTVASANGNHWEDERRRGSMQSDVRTTALVLQALVAAEPEHPLIEETVRWLTIARNADRWETNLERSDSVVGLADFASLTGELSGDFTYRVRLDDRDLIEGEVTPGGASAAEHVEVPLADLRLGAVNLLTMLRDGGAGRLYYGVNLRYATPAAGIEARNRGFAVSHEYSLLDAPETRIDGAPAGEIVRVRVTVVTDASRKFVVVEDLMPAGLEPIDPVLNITPIEVRQQLEAERREAFEGEAPDYFAPWFPWYFNPWDHVDTRDDRVVLYSDSLPAGVHEFIYYARATTPGDYFVAPAHAEESFFPEVFGRSDSSRFTVN
ncbi:MAG: Ig-like domain-containing protein [Dehalococcoidia bacterium]